MLQFGWFFRNGRLKRVGALKSLMHLVLVIIHAIVSRVASSSVRETGRCKHISGATPMPCHMPKNAARM